ncbi:MAG: cache domain-containing protein, partial [Thermoguttaceae bacterium]
RITSAARCWRWCDRNPLASIMVFSFVVILIGSLSLALWWAFGESQRLVIKLTLDTLVAETQPAVNEIHRTLSEAQGDVIRVARSPAISGIIRTWDNEGTDQQQRSTSEVRIDRLAVILTTLLETHRERRFYSVVDDKGQEILHVTRDGRTPDDERKNVGQTAFYLAASQLAKAQVYVSPMQLDENGNASLYVATPLFDSGNKYRGILLCGLDGRRILTSAVGGNRYDIVDESGMYLYCRADPSKEFGKARYNRDKAFGGADVMSSGSSAGDELVHQVAHIPGRNRPDGVSLMSVYRVCYYAPDHSRFWAIVLNIPDDEALTPIHQLRNTFLLQGLVAPLVMIVLSVIIPAIMMRRRLRREFGSRDTSR